MRRSIECALRIKDQASKYAGLRGAWFASSTLTIVVEQHLRLVPCLAVDDGRMLTRVALFLLFDQTDVVRVAQERIERDSVEVVATAADDVVLAHPVAQSSDVAEAQEFTEDRANGHGFGFVQK